MKKLLLSIAVTSALGLSGCGGDSVADIKEQVKQDDATTEPLSRVVFDPANALVLPPNDLLFSGTTDGTLNFPNETVGEGEEVNYTDPETAIGALDGWSTVTPFSIDIETSSDEVTLDSSTAALPGAVRLFEATTGGALSRDASCQSQPSVSACKIGRELTFGTEFVTMGSGNSILVIPTMPLKAGQTYLLAVTDIVQDSNNNSIAPSSTYESVRLDVTTKPLPLESQLSLQTIVNSYEDRLEEAGVDQTTVVYSATFTTQSTDDVFNAAKLFMLPASNQPVLEPFMPHDDGDTAGDALVKAGLIVQDSPTYVGASRASISMSKLHAPYYLDKPTAQNCVVSSPSDLSPATCPGLYSRFQALGDSPVTVLGALQAGLLPQAVFMAQYDAQKAAFGRGDFTGDPAQLAGMQFNIGTAEKPVYLDGARHTTRFNPIPKVMNNPVTDTIDVLVSTPNLTVINQIRQAQSKDLLEKPVNGWPVMIYAHGITTNKETLYAFAGAMAEAGVAVVAIDHPLHGSRAGAMTIENVGVAPLSAGDNATVYLNLASLLTARDNVRQSVLDLLALRLSLLKTYNASPAVGLINPLDVSFYGHSLGGITGMTFTASANTDVLGDATMLNPYEIKSASFLAPGGGIPGFLLESASFSGTVKTGVTASASFQAQLLLAAAAKEITPEQLAALKDAGAPEYDQLVDAVYGPFSAQFNFAAQTIVDSGDPVNYATTLAANTPAIHVMEVVGNGSDKLPDQVVPNNTVGSALSGTDPLVALAQLPKITETASNENGVKGVVRFTDGHHSSILTPAVSYPGNDPAQNLIVLVEMQTQLAGFIGSGGKVLPITQTSVIEQ